MQDNSGRKKVNNILIVLILGALYGLIATAVLWPNGPKTQQRLHAVNPSEFKQVLETIKLPIKGQTLLFSEDRWVMASFVLDLDSIKEDLALPGSFKDKSKGVSVLISNRDFEGIYTRFYATEKLLDVLREKGFNEVKQDRIPWLSIILSLLPSLLLLLFLLSSFSGGGLKKLFGHRATALSKESVKTRFADVEGCDEAKQEVMELVEFLKNPKKFADIGGRVPKGLLLVGPPGTGKTLMAQAIAGEAGVPYLSMNGSDFVELFAGLGARRVRDLFEDARKKAPCLIFIDEIDSIGKERGNKLSGNDEREQTLNSLLVEMDGVLKATLPVIVIAATNRAELLDAALLRPGRFDRIVQLELPDIKGREAILRVHAKGLKVSEDVDWQTIAKATTGMSGAELANVLNEAAILAVRTGIPTISTACMMAARDRVMFGQEKRKLTELEEREQVAVHEAGHALVHMLLNDPALELQRVTIIPRGKSLGSTQFIKGKDNHNYTEAQLLNKIAMALGGRVAEELVLKSRSIGASGDIQHITMIARSMVTKWGMSPLGMLDLDPSNPNTFLSPDVGERIQLATQSIVDEQYARTMGLLRGNLKLLVLISKVLQEQETLTCEELGALIRKFSREEQN